MCRRSRCSRNPRSGRACQRESWPAYLGEEVSSLLSPSPHPPTRRLPDQQAQAYASFDPPQTPHPSGQESCPPPSQESLGDSRGQPPPLRGTSLHLPKSLAKSVHEE